VKASLYVSSCLSLSTLLSSVITCVYNNCLNNNCSEKFQKLNFIYLFLFIQTTKQKLLQEFLVVWVSLLFSL